MATATQTQTPKATGFKHLPCPLCGAVADDDGDGGLFVRLSDMSVRCPNCEEEVTRKDLERLIADAQRLLRWLDAAAEL